MAAFENVYCVLDTNGNLVDEQDNPVDAIEAAKRAARRDGGGVYATLDQLDPESDKVVNPAGTVTGSYTNRSGLEQGIARTGGVKGPDGYHIATKQTVMAISLEEAHRRLNDWFPQGKAFRSVKDTPKKFFLPNTKMAKEASEVFSAAGLGKISASSNGLSLLPHYVPFRGGTEPSAKGAQFTLMRKSQEQILDHYNPENPKSEGGPSGPSWCAYSSLGCRATCLVYSGQNQVADESIIYKHAMAAALLHDPMAFLRIMVEGIRAQMNYKGPSERWVRLNVYQDIPWEVMFPDLFDLAGTDRTSGSVGGWIPALRSYDYTKTPRRDFIDNYNLTFSYSGENVAACRNELKAGRNVAAVFYMPKMKYTKRGGWSETGKQERIRSKHMEQMVYPLDVEGIFSDGPMPVLNGDLHDIRPYDRMVLEKLGWNRGGAVVGLDYKMPQIKVGKGKTVSINNLDKAGKFVVRIQKWQPTGANQEPVMLVGGGVAAYMLTEIE